MMRLFTFALIVCCGATSAQANNPLEADVIVYGSTPGGVCAAIAAAQAKPWLHYFDCTLPMNYEERVSQIVALKVCWSVSLSNTGYCSNTYRVCERAQRGSWFW
jgi:hypothetical protein